MSRQKLAPLAEAHAFVEYLKHLPTWAEAERELQGKSAGELRQMVLVQLASFKRLQLGGTKQQPSDDYLRWSRAEPL